MSVYLLLYTLFAFLACLILIYLRLPTDARQATEVGILSLFWPLLLCGLLLASSCLLIWHYLLDPAIVLLSGPRRQEEEEEQE